MDGNANGNGHGNASRAFGQRRPSVREAARGYLARGWRVIPLKAREKTPEFKSWTTLRIAPVSVDTYFLPTSNIGILTGSLTGAASGSGNGNGEAGWSRIDVDLDTPEAIAAAAVFLPPTGLVHGRPSKPASHYWYLVEGPVETAKFALPVGNRGLERPAHNAEGLKPPEDAAHAGPSGPMDCAPVIHGREAAPRGSAMFVELRAGGCQTMAPPSIHPCGELLRWERPHPPAPSPTGRGGGEGEPGRVSAGELRRAVGHVAAGALLAHSWPAQGLRDEAALALCGMLLRGGWSAEAADEFVRVVAKIAGDEEWKQRGKGRQTARTLEAGEPVWGAPALAERLGEGGERVVAKVREWLGLTAHDGSSVHRYSSPSTGAHARNMSICSPNEYLCHLDTVLLSGVRAERLRWLWAGRIPLGALTLLDGDPGLGKSLVTLDLIARLTTGRAMPGELEGAPALDAGAVLLSAEDDLATAIRPRLAAAGADVSRVLAVQTVREQNAETGRQWERAFTLPQDIALLEEAIRRVGAKLVVIDPLMAYLDARVNSWRDQDVRATLAPLARLAQRTGVAVLILRHLTKGGGANAVYRGGGSIGIIGAARSGLLIAKDPETPETERVLVSSKSNLGPPVPGLRYRITLTPEVGPRIEWLGASAHTAATLLCDTGAQEDHSALEEACAFLREALGEGPQPATHVQQTAKSAGISRSTLQRARGRAGVCARFEGLRTQGRWVWELAAGGDDLPAADAAEPGIQSPGSGSQILMSPTDTHATDVSACSRDEYLCAPGLAENRHGPTCPATGLAHEYHQMRDVKGRRLCVACEQVEQVEEVGE